MYKTYKEEFKERIKDKTLEELKEIKFNIDMIDRWTQENAYEYDAVCERIRELTGFAKI